MTLQCSVCLLSPVLWHTHLFCADGTPYEGGYFKVKFKFTEEFPAAPPKCKQTRSLLHIRHPNQHFTKTRHLNLGWFITKIFHPNVSKQGEICVNTLKKDWKKEYGIAHILVTVKCLLIYPNPESALDEAAGKLLLEKYEDYCKHAKVMTSVHATPKVSLGIVQHSLPRLTGPLGIDSTA